MSPHNGGELNPHIIKHCASAQGIGRCLEQSINNLTFASVMTHEEIDILSTPDVREAIERNLGGDPLRIALDKRIPHAALVASQVKYLDRARKKLPSYYEARCIIPSLAFEQSSSEDTASRKDFGGGTCIDLTCGLGVDSLYLSRKFEKVLSVERDEALARVALINFGRLGAENIEVVHSSAEDFLREYASEGGRADAIYADPDRRGSTGRKLVRLEDCSPDVLSLMPLMKQVAGKVAIKASPLFDVDEAFRLFGERCRVTVVSLGGECKEVLIETGGRITVPAIEVSAIGVGSAEFAPGNGAPAPGIFSPPYRFMIVPDVALRKARLVADYFAATMPGAFVASPNGYVFADEAPPDGMMGKVFAIAAMDVYSPGKLKTSLRARGIRSAGIYLHDFPRSAARICLEAGVREGNGIKLAFTTIVGKLWTIELKELTLSD